MCTETNFEKGIFSRGKAISSQSSHTTGTSSGLNLSPDLINSLNKLKDFNVSQDFKKLAQFISFHQQQLPQRNGQCTHYFIPKYIMEKLFDYQIPEDIPEEIKEKSTFPVYIFEGTATIGYNRDILWNQLPWEQDDFYSLFKVYRDSRYVTLGNGEIIPQPRSLGQLGRMLNLRGILFTTLSDIYGWPYRLAYYDNYIEQINQGYQLLAQKSIVAEQLKITQDLQTKVYEAIKLTIRNFKPIDLIKLLEVVFKFSRISIDLPGDKPISDLVKPTLNIYNTTHNMADQIMSVNSISSTEDKLKATLHDVNNLQSILHILQTSGAINTSATDIIDVEIPDTIDINIDNALIASPLEDKVLLT